jgi:hypothetical protein
MTASGPQHVVFLHGYTTPDDPPAETLLLALNRAGISPALHMVKAPEGDDRRDPFNPEGAASWFRYSTDLSQQVPQVLDLADLDDVRAVLTGGWTSHDRDWPGLWNVIAELAGRSSAPDIALVGESQGGVMATLVAMEWNRSNPDNQLGWLGLVRTAPDPRSWQPLSQLADPPSEPGVYPPRFETRFAVVLGEDDLTYRTYTSLAALGPLLVNNPIAEPGIGVYSRPHGNVQLAVLPGVTHDSHRQLVFDTLAAMLTDPVSP